MSIPWLEQMTVFAVNPDAADRDDVARIVADCMACRAELYRLRDIVSPKDAESIDRILNG